MREGAESWGRCWAKRGESLIRQVGSQSQDRCWEGLGQPFFGVIPWAIAAGTTKILNKDDRSCEKQALSAREFPRFFSGLKNYTQRTKRVEGKRAS